MTEKDGLEREVVAVLTSGAARALVEQYAEPGVDVLLERGAGEHIPIVGTIVGVAKLGANGGASVNI